VTGPRIYVRRVHPVVACAFCGADTAAICYVGDRVACAACFDRLAVPADRTRAR
jgi:hypothetical protein